MTQLLSDSLSIVHNNKLYTEVPKSIMNMIMIQKQRIMKAHTLQGDNFVISTVSHVMQFKVREENTLVTIYDNSGLNKTLNYYFPTFK